MTAEADDDRIGIDAPPLAIGCEPRAGGTAVVDVEPGDHGIEAELDADGTGMADQFLDEEAGVAGFVVRGIERPRQLVRIARQRRLDALTARAIEQLGTDA